MPIVNYLLLAIEGVAPECFCILIGMQHKFACPVLKQILNFRDLLTRAARSQGSNEKFIPNMPRVLKSSPHAGQAKFSGLPGMPSSLACQAYQNQSLACCKRTGLFLESTAILSLAKLSY